MKISKVFLLILAISLVFAGCKKGDQGPAGAPGSNGSNGSSGATGATGQQGQPGPTGTANVIASQWFKVDSSVWTHTAADSFQYNRQYLNYLTNTWTNYLDTEIIFHAIVPTPLITAGIKDSGMVLFYYKDSTGNGFAYRVGKVMPIFPVGVDNYQNHYNNTTTATNHLTKSGYFFFQSASDTLGQSFSIKTFWFGSDAKYENTNITNPHSGYGIYDDIKYEELAPKTAIFFRYIIIPAGKTSRMIAPVDYKDYNAVLKYYHLEDK